MDKVLNLDRSQRLDLICRKGDTFTLNLELKDDDGVALDLNNQRNKYTFKMDVRPSDTSDLNIVDVTPKISLDTPGLVTFSVDAVDMIMDSGLYVYDVQQTRTDMSAGSNGLVLSVDTLIYGTFKVNEDVTIAQK
jgi:hypothetical protein